MSGAQHTPGPWEVRSGPVVQHGGYYVADCTHPSVDDEAQRANAQLIALAPALTVELAKCIGALRGIADGMERERQAPKTVQMLRDVALDAMKMLVQATGAAS